jgi:hypothetical protein
MLRRYDRRSGNRYPTFGAIQTSIAVKVWRAGLGRISLGGDHSIKGDMMGVFDDPKEAARATAEQFGERAEGGVKADAKSDATGTAAEREEKPRD